MPAGHCPSAPPRPAPHPTRPPTRPASPATAYLAKWVCNTRYPQAARVEVFLADIKGMMICLTVCLPSALLYRVMPRGTSTINQPLCTVFATNVFYSAVATAVIGLTAIGILISFHIVFSLGPILTQCILYYILVQCWHGIIGPRLPCNGCRRTTIYGCRVLPTLVQASNAAGFYCCCSSIGPVYIQSRLLMLYGYYCCCLCVFWSKLVMLYGYYCCCLCVFWSNLLMLTGYYCCCLCVFSSKLLMLTGYYCCCLCVFSSKLLMLTGYYCCCLCIFWSRLLMLTGYYCCCLCVFCPS